MKSHQTTRITPRAFTLVELLVVIAIIGVLVSMLIPALSQSRYTARKVVSLSQMKQIGIAIYAYAQDNAGYVPNSVRQDQGCNFWGNFYIIVYPTQLVFNTIGSTIHPYVSKNTVFMAPNHFEHLTSTYLPNNDGNYYLWYGWAYNPAATTFNITSYSYMPWLGFAAYPAGPTMKTEGKLGGVSFNNLAMLVEEVAVENRDALLSDPFKSVNWDYSHNVAEGGNIIFGDGSGHWVPLAGYLNGMNGRYQPGGYTYTNHDVFYRY